MKDGAGGVFEVLGTTATKLVRMFGSDRNTRLSQQVIVVLLGVTMMGTVMYALFDVTRVIHPVAHVEGFLGIHLAHPHAAAAPVTGAGRE